MCDYVYISVTLILAPHLGKNVYMHQYIYLCLPHSPCLLHPISIFAWKHGFLCVALCVCSSHSTSVPTPCLECVYPSVHVFLSTWLSMSAPPPMHSYMQTWISQCGTVCVAVIPLLFPHLGQNVYMHQYMYACPPDSQYHLKALCIVVWKHKYSCMALCLCPSHLISVPIPCLECVHASGHVFMSTQLPMLAQPPMDSYMETWVPLCDTVSVSQSHCFWSHTLVRMCTCISTCIQVHLTPEVCSTPFA